MQRLCIYNRKLELIKCITEDFMVSKRITTKWRAEKDYAYGHLVEIIQIPFIVFDMWSLSLNRSQDKESIIITFEKIKFCYNGLNLYILVIVNDADEEKVIEYSPWNKEDIKVSKLTTNKRKKLPKSDFAGADRSYPINDKSHAANAKARATQMVKKGKLSESSKMKIDAKANKMLGQRNDKEPMAGKKSMAMTMGKKRNSK